MKSKLMSYADTFQSLNFKTDDNTLTVKATKTHILEPYLHKGSSRVINKSSSLQNNAPIPIPDPRSSILSKSPKYNKRTGPGTPSKFSSLNGDNFNQKNRLNIISNSKESHGNDFKIRKNQEILFNPSRRNIKGLPPNNSANKKTKQGLISLNVPDTIEVKSKTPLNKNTNGYNEDPSDSRRSGDLNIEELEEYANTDDDPHPRSPHSPQRSFTSFVAANRNQRSTFLKEASSSYMTKSQMAKIRNLKTESSPKKQKLSFKKNFLTFESNQSNF